MKKKIIAKHMSKKDGALLAGFITKHFPDGIVTPEELVRLASPKKSAIHHLFTWDDTEAARKWRLYEARKMIGCLVVEIEPGEEVRKYVAVAVDRGDEPHGYYDLDVAKNDKTIWAEVLRRAMQEANTFVSKYKHLKELSLIHTAIEKTNKKLGMENES